MKTILVADDDEAILKIYSFMLRRVGYQVVTFVDGVTTYEYIQKNPPDLVLIDVMMPKLSGFEIIDRMKTDNALKSIPIIVITNLSENSISQTAINKGALKCLIKDQMVPKQIVAEIQKIVPL
ncbi:hypothetical protein A2154_03690 [Candidatus Gottesmanbacteria bacterium RBG_16_43_7]|uniref:Response regulatory domain-containing protein n=1 Tax=Candidatus Gottesmanbacteria bacterium RBG_16_43_7 TaxID=1798373 RepID=A0A1F5Z904_9BACT|nr:MAG: hypothetical protein A2154_03690 [Candidatus Gottesmanbacteria bacterium RBG_16_43_7]